MLTCEYIYIPVSLYITIVIKCFFFSYSFSFRIANGNTKDIPHPDADWNAFLMKIKLLNAKENPVFDTITSKMKPWIDIEQLKRAYGGDQKSGVCSIS